VRGETGLSRPILALSRYLHLFQWNLSMAAMSSMDDRQAQKKDAAEVESLLAHVLARVRSAGLICGKSDAEEAKVVDFVHPEELSQLMDLAVAREPASRATLEAAIDKAIQYSVRTTHRHFYNQLYHGVDGYGLAGAWLTDALNTNNHTFEVAPVFIVAERALLTWAAEKFGYKAAESDGIFSPGGSISNMYGMMLARHKRFPDLKSKGVYGHAASPLLIFTSEESHYSVSKGANWLGLGTDNVVKVKSDQQGRMTGPALEEALSTAVGTPLAVMATSGSTVMGAYDDLFGLADVCAKRGLWLHVDACWGGAAVLSKKHK